MLSVAVADGFANKCRQGKRSITDKKSFITLAPGHQNFEEFVDGRAVGVQPPRGHLHCVLKRGGYYRILLSIVRTFFTENDAEILPAHYTWKVTLTNLIHKQSIQVIL